MVKRPIFALFLTISVIVILVGIALIIAIQIDRGYVLADIDHNYDQQQDAILQEFYQHSSDSQSAREESMSASQQPADTRSPNNIPVNTSASTLDSGRTSTDPYQDSYRRYLEYEQRRLSMNPWSPDYRPPWTR